MVFMLLPWVAALVAGAVLLSCWDDVVNFVRDFVKQVASHWQLYVKDVLDGAWESILQRLSDDIYVVAQRYYFKGTDGNFYREVECEKISSNDVPEKFRDKIKVHPVTDGNGCKYADITEDMKQELALY